LSWHTGLLTGTYIVAIFLFAPLWGKVSDRRGRRPVILLGLTGFAATALFYVHLSKAFDDDIGTALT
jgi:MFS family permease